MEEKNEAFSSDSSRELLGRSAMVVLAPSTYGHVLAILN